MSAIQTLFTGWTAGRENVFASREVRVDEKQKYWDLGKEIESISGEDFHRRLDVRAAELAFKLILYSFLRSASVSNSNLQQSWDVLKKFMKTEKITKSTEYNNEA